MPGAGQAASAGRAASAFSIRFLRRRAFRESSESRDFNRKASSPPRCSTERSAWALTFRRIGCASTSLRKVTAHRFGRNRRRVLLLAWLTLLPVWTVLPVSSQRRAMRYAPTRGIVWIIGPAVQDAERRHRCAHGSLRLRRSEPVLYASWAVPSSKCFPHAATLPHGRNPPDVVETPNSRSRPQPDCGSGTGAGQAGR